MPLLLFLVALALQCALGSAARSTLLMRNDRFGGWKYMATASIGLSLLGTPFIALGDDLLKSQLADIQYEKVSKTNAPATSPVTPISKKQKNGPVSTTTPTVSAPTSVPVSKPVASKPNPAATKPVVKTVATPKAAAQKKAESSTETTYSVKKDEKLLNSVNSARKMTSLTTIQGAAGYLDVKVNAPQQAAATPTVAAATKGTKAKLPEEVSYELAVAKKNVDQARLNALNAEFQGLKKVSGNLQGNINSLESKIKEVSRGLNDKNSPSAKKAELYKLKLDLTQQQSLLIKESKKSNDLMSKESYELELVKKRLVSDNKEVKDRKEKFVAKEKKLRIDAKNNAIKVATNNFNTAKSKLEASSKDAAALSANLKALQQSLKEETAVLNKAVVNIKSLESELAKAKGFVQSETSKVTEIGSKVTALNEEVTRAASVKKELLTAYSESNKKLNSVK